MNNKQALLCRADSTLESMNQAVWHYDRLHNRIRWANPAALEYWCCDDLQSLQQIDNTGLENHHWQTDSEDTVLYLPSGPILCRIQPLYDQHWLIEQLVTDGSNKHIRANYDLEGQLIGRSQNARRLFHPQDDNFRSHFCDPNQADKVWQQIQQQHYFRDSVLVDTRMGPRRHDMEARLDTTQQPATIYIQEQDLNQYLPGEDAIDSLLREQEVIQEHAGIGIAFIKERRIIRCNQRMGEILEYCQAELTGAPALQIYADRESYNRIGAEAYPLLNTGELYLTTIQLKRKNGSLVWCKLRGKMIASGHKEQGFIWIVDDISQEMASRKVLKQISTEQQLILDNAMVGIVFLKNRIVTRCNSRFADMFGYKSSDLIGRTTEALHQNNAAFERMGREGYRPLSRGQVFHAEKAMRHRNGKEIWTDLRAKAIDPNDLSAGTIWIAMDISDRKQVENALNEANDRLETRVSERTQELYDAMRELHQEIADRCIAEERIKHLAHHDALTGLPNRSMLEERLTETLSQAEANDEQVAVLFIDLDRFKTINDSLGHHEGDQLLKNAANRLRQATRSTDMVARLGGDEFVVILKHLENCNQIEAVLEKIQNKFRKEMRLGLQDLIVTLSIGVSIFPQDGNEPRTLLKCADAAMYHAKHKGRNCYRFFDDTMNNGVSDRMKLEHALHLAIKQRQFEVHYQPQVAFDTGEIVGVEALVRWRHSEKGLISPMDFIPLAEETGQILELGNWVLLEACKTAQRWKNAGLPAITMSVNLSAVQIGNDNFVAKVQQILDETGIEPQQLDLEITESSIMRNVEETIDRLNQLHAMGIQLSIDDFGTGYSSLSYLKRFPIDKLKIDRSFVREIDINQDDAMICHTIISMAKILSLKVVAEGVETTNHHEQLSTYRCDYYQGYFFSKPKPEAEITEILSRSLQANYAMV